MVITLLRNLFLKFARILNENYELNKYYEYKSLDTPLGFRGLAKYYLLDEYIEYMENLRNYFLEKNMPAIKGTKATMPKPSRALENFKNSFLINRKRGVSL